MYDYKNGARPPKKRPIFLLWILGAILLIGGLYLLYDTLAPSTALMPIIGDSDVLATQNLLKKGDVSGSDRLYLPQINVNEPINTGDASVLEKGAWHRKPDEGDPVKGGNFILSAHRFSMGWTPQQTRAKSPFYNIDKLQVGDQIYVDFQGKRYAYKIDRTYQVPRTATEIEAPSTEAKLTLYSCDLRGEAAGRDVIEAKPMGLVADGQIQLSQ